MCSPNEPPNFSLPHHDPDTYWGRVKNYLVRHNVCNIFATPDTLDEAKCLYLKYRCEQPLHGDVTEEELWRAKELFESAYHPETGEKIMGVARPPAHVLVNSILAGGMMAFYHSTLGVVLWQSLNQTYNTLMGYAFRGDEETVTDNQLITSYGLATGTAVGTALGLNSLLKCSSSLVARFVPLGAVAAAHCISVPLMRAQTLKNGTPIYDDDDTQLGYSKTAAQAGISGAVSHKILNAVPPMVLAPIIMHQLEQRGTLCRYPWVNLPGHAAIAFLCLTFLSPLTCALVNQRKAIPFKHLEPEAKDFLCKKLYNRPPKYVYFDRGI